MFKANNLLLYSSAIIGLCFRHKIQDLFYDCILDNVSGLFCKGVSITSRNPKNMYAMKNELTKKLGDNYLTVAADSRTLGVAEFILPYGRYFISESIGLLLVNYQEENISLRLLLPAASNLMSSFVMRYLTYLFLFTSYLHQAALKEYVQRVYKEQCSSCKIIVFFTSNSDRWNFPIIREPRNFDSIPLTPSLTQLLDDVKEFKGAESIYVKQGIPYRRGYLLYGEPGTYKSMSAEMLAKQYNMSIYMLNLNSPEMSDSVLINLVSRVPANSIIVIEEVDKQMETLKKSNNSYVSVGGFLTALDGPQRLSHGTLVILTANQKSFLGNDNENALYRPGRIDKIYEYTRQ